MTTSIVPAAAVRSSASESAPRAALRWAHACLAKNTVLRLAIRSALLPMLITVAGALFTAFGPVAVQATSAGTVPEDSVVFVVIGYLVFGQIVLLVSTAWLYVREAMSRELGVDYLVQPRRGVMVIGTAIVAALGAGISSLLCLVAGYLTFGLASGGDVVAIVAAPAVARMIVTLPIGTALLGVLAVSVAVLLRNGIAAAVVVVLWTSFGEDTLARIPMIGAVLHTLAPMNNVFVAAGVVAGGGIVENPWLCLLWTGVLAVGATALAVFVEDRRKGWVS